MPSLTTAGPASRSHSTPEQPLRKPAAPGLLAGAGAEAEEPEPAGAPAAPPPPFDELPVQAPSTVPPATTMEPARTDRPGLGSARSRLYRSAPGPRQPGVGGVFRITGSSSSSSPGSSRSGFH